MRHKSTPKLNNIARTLRTRSTIAEHFLWKRLRNRQLDGLKFRRQEPVGNYVADFLCSESHVIVELDGGQHGADAHMQHDAERTAYLRLHGYTVLRFRNTEVIRNMENALQYIRDVCKGERKPLE